MLLHSATGVALVVWTFVLPPESAASVERMRMALRKPSPSQSNIAWVPTASAPSKREDLKVPAAMDKHRCGRHRMVLEAVVARLHASGSR